MFQLQKEAGYSVKIKIIIAIMYSFLTLFTCFNLQPLHEGLFLETHKLGYKVSSYNKEPKYNDSKQKLVSLSSKIPGQVRFLLYEIVRELLLGQFYLSQLLGSISVSKVTA